ncbi:hypothetical protein E4U10_008409 [Claviceps purpurea]|nr:hypothetical protein E4U10_008409 [Claviceps purpurea]
MPLNPAFLGTTTAFSGSLDAFSVQSHHQPNMSGNNNFSFSDAQPDQFAAVATPEMEFPSMPSTTPADAHGISDGSPTALQTHMWTTGYGSQLRQNQENHVTLTINDSQSPLLATVATHEQKAFGAVGKAFEPKVTGYSRQSCVQKVSGKRNDQPEIQRQGQGPCREAWLVHG